VNEKELKDVCASCSTSPSVEGIDPERITEGFGQRDRVLRSSQEVREILEEAPKSVPWRLRSIVGKRMRRYELPEETGA
jgi:hypothetical protein